MSAKKIYFIMLAIIGLLFVGLAVGAYEVNGLLAKRAVNLTSLKAKSLAQSQEQTSLTKAQKDVHKYTGLQQIANQVVPEDKDQAEAVREIANIAAANNVNLSAITFPASTLGSTATGTPITNTSSSASASASSKLGKLSQLQPVKNIPGVYVLQITVQSDQTQPVQYAKFINFLSALEHNRRTAQVSTIAIQPNTKDHNLLSFNLSLNEYIKP